MSRRLSPLAPLVMALLVLTALPAAGATALESARAGSASAREKISGLRSQQMSLRSELNGVAARIEALKAERQGKVLKGGELEQALRRSQELSGSLTELAQAVASAEGEAQKQNLALLSALSQELSELRTRFDATQDRALRKGLLDRMRGLRAERDQVRAALPATALPALETARPSDDPEDLLEQADLLRDNEDKVRRELTALDARIREVREERELDRRMNDFLADDSMFDESDRRLRTRVPTPAKTAVRETSGTGFESDSNSSAPPPGGSTGVGAPAPQTPTPTPEPTRSKDETSKPNPTGQPLLGQGRDLKLTGQELDDLSALEAHKKRLQGLADELNRRAKQVEQRANELR